MFLAVAPVIPFCANIGAGYNPLDGQRLEMVVDGIAGAFLIFLFGGHRGYVPQTK
jgi:hypothetical protein